jgi:hypothetical protein
MHTHLRVEYVSVDPLELCALLVHEIGELGEYRIQLCDCLLDRGGLVIPLLAFLNVGAHHQDNILLACLTARRSRSS